MWRWIAPVAALMLAASCIGDPGYSLIVQNSTRARVTFYVDGVNARPGSAFADGVTLEPGAEDVNHWVIPAGDNDQRKATVRAVNSAGSIVYCHRFGFAELRDLHFHIDLRGGVADCS